MRHHYCDRRTFTTIALIVISFFFVCANIVSAQQKECFHGITSRQDLRVQPKMGSYSWLGP
jgi:hypothetical protein